jgi:ATPase subunit of ABC transporter with duplicated ATPase domains
VVGDRCSYGTSVKEGDALQVGLDVVNEALSVMADLGLTMEVVRQHRCNSSRHPLTLKQTEVAKMSAEAATILSGLGFSQNMIDGPFAALSGGWKSRCSLAGSLLIQSDVLLLDEPSNFLVRSVAQFLFFWC